MWTWELKELVCHPPVRWGCDVNRSLLAAYASCNSGGATPLRGEGGLGSAEDGGEFCWLDEEEGRKQGLILAATEIILKEDVRSSWRLGNRVRELGYCSRQLCLPLGTWRKCLIEDSEQLKTKPSVKSHRSFSCLVRFKRQMKRKTTFSQGLDATGLVAHPQISELMHQSPDPAALPPTRAFPLDQKGSICGLLLHCTKPLDLVKIWTRTY